MIRVRSSEFLDEFNFEPGLVTGIEITQDEVTVRTLHTRSNFTAGPVESLTLPRASIHQVRHYSVSGLVILMHNDNRRNPPIPGYSRLSLNT